MGALNLPCPLLGTLPQDPEPPESKDPGTMEGLRWLSSCSSDTQHPATLADLTSLLLALGLNDLICQMGRLPHLSQEGCL